jgi:hypothetical protein
MLKGIWVDMNVMKVKKPFLFNPLKRSKIQIQLKNRLLKEEKLTFWRNILGFFNIKIHFPNMEG